LPIILTLAIVAVVIAMIFVSARNQKKQMREYEILKRELEAECMRKYSSNGVQILLKFRQHVVHGHKSSHIVQVPYLELILFEPISQEQQYGNYQPNNGQMFVQPNGQYIQPQVDYVQNYQNLTTTQQYVQQYPTENNYQFQQNQNYQQLNSPTFYQK
jgi:hypothetical protein